MAKGHIKNQPAADAAAYIITVDSPGSVIANKSGFAEMALPTPPTTPEAVVNKAVCV